VCVRVCVRVCVCVCVCVWGGRFSNYKAIKMFRNLRTSGYLQLQIHLCQAFHHGQYHSTPKPKKNRNEKDQCSFISFIYLSFIMHCEYTVTFTKVLTIY
jgi:hypothetical protein